MGKIHSAILTVRALHFLQLIGTPVDAWLVISTCCSLRLPEVIQSEVYNFAILYYEYRIVSHSVSFRNASKKERRFLVIDVTQMIMVEPDASRLGWGVVRFSGYLQVTGVDYRRLNAS